MVTVCGLCDHTQKLSENCIYSLAASRSRQTAPERLLQTHSTFSKLVMVSMSVSKLGPMDLILIDARVKINGAYYLEHLIDVWHRFEQSIIDDSVDQ